MLHKLRPQDEAASLRRALVALPRSYEMEAEFPKAGFALLSGSSLDSSSSTSRMECLISRTPKWTPDLIVPHSEVRMEKDFFGRGSP